MMTNVRVYKANGQLAIGCHCERSEARQLATDNR